MRILFQGDSITDWDRVREDFYDLGLGYVKYAAEQIKNRHPDTEFEFINRGVACDQTSHLLARWQTDCIDLQPDVVSILIGMNDVWVRAEEKVDWLDNDIFESNYRQILTQTKEKTHAKIIMLEPFLLYTPEKAWFRVDLAPKIEIVRALAREFADVYIPLDGIFAAASVGVKPLTWTIEGVHPTEAGAHLIANHYANAFDSIFPMIK